MKKVVLLAGAIAAGMAVAPAAANAASPKAPEIDGINLTANQLTALMEEVADINQEAQDYFSASKIDLTLPNLASAPDGATLKANLATAITALNSLDQQIQAYFSDHVGGDGEYKTSFLSGHSGHNHDGATNAFVTTRNNVVPAYYAALNAALAADYKNSKNYTDLQDALTAAQAVTVPNAPYNDAIYDDLNTYYKAALQAQVDDAETNVETPVTGYASANDQNTQAHYVDIKSEAAAITTKINNYLNEYYPKANTLAEEALLKALEDHDFDAKIEAVVDTEAEGLAHHPEAADDTAVQAAKTTATNAIDDIKTWIESLEPSSIPYSPNPDAVQAWADRNDTDGLNDKIDAADALIEKWQEAVYIKALDLDKTDIATAITEVNGLVSALDPSPVKDYLDKILTDPTYDPTCIAQEQKKLVDDIADAIGTDICTEFASLDQRVTDLKARIANLKAAMTDIADLNADVVALQQEIDDQAYEDGYAPFTTDWTTTEQGDLDTVIADINTAINNITKAEGSWVGKDSFADAITLEYDHHDWLAEWQKANYDAKETLVSEIDLRYNEYRSVAESNLTAEDCVQAGTNFEAIVGEDDPSAFIYKVAFFDDIYAQFSDDDPALATEGDIRYDRINDAYDNKNAQTIGTFADWKAAADAAAKAALVAGYLKDVTAEGVEDVLVEGDPTAKADVVFGALQKTIQNAYAKIVENEKANKALHVAYEETVQYIADAQADIDTYAKLDFKADAKTIKVYDFATRQETDKVEGAIDFVGEIDHEGNTAGVSNYKAETLADTYYKEGGNVDPSAATVDYNAIDKCDHDTKVWGWTVIGTNMTDLKDLEQKEYDAVRSQKLLDGDTKYTDSDSNDLTFEETLTKVEENVDDITNEAYTQMVRNGLAYVQTEINNAKVWAAGVDGICDETNCNEADVKNNPCGWDAKTPQDAIKQIVEDWNEQLTNLGTAHSAETADDHADAVDNFLKFQEYVTKALADIRAWQVAFAAADKTHKQNILNAFDLAVNEAHTVHHYSQEAHLAVQNFSEDGADEAAANIWAADFNERKIGTFDGQEVTFQQFVKNIDDKVVALADPNYNHDGDPDLYEAMKRIGQDGIKTFQDYVDGTKYLEEFLKVYAENLKAHHLYTELKQLAEGMKTFNWEADFNKKLEANKDEHARMETVLANLETEVKAIELAASELYGEEYTGDVEKTKKSALDDEVTAILEKVAQMKTDVTSAYLSGVADKFNTEGKITEASFPVAVWGAFSAEDKASFEAYLYKPADVTTAITTLKTALEAAKTLYADNVAAKAKYEAELAQIEAELAAFSSEVEAEINNGNIYVKSADVTAPKNNETVKAAVQTVTTALANEADHITNGFNAGVLAYDGAEDATDAKDNKTEVEKHLADARTKLQAARTALVEAQALYAQNVAAKLEKQAQLENLKRDLKEFVVADGTVYSTADGPDKYVGDKPNYTKEALEGVIKLQEEEVTTAFENLDKAFNAGTAPAFVVPATVAPALDQAIKDLEAAKKYYADNHEALVLLETALEEFEAQAAQELHAVEEAAANGLIYTVEVAGDGVVNDKGDVLAKAEVLGLDADGKVATEHEHYHDKFTKGTLAADTEEKTHLTALATKLQAVEDALVAATAYKAKNVENYEMLYAELQAAEENLATLNTEYAALDVNTVYNVEGRKDLDTIKDLVEAARKLVNAAETDNVPAALDAALKAGKAYSEAEVAALSAKVAAITTAVEAARAEIAKDVKFYAQSVETRDKLVAEYNAALNNKTTLDTEWAVAKDVVYAVEEGKNDKKTIQDAIDALKVTETIGDINKAFDEAKVIENEATLKGEVKALNDAVEAARKLIEDALKFKHDNVEAYDRLLAQLEAVKETRNDLTTEWKNTKDHVYEVEGHKDQTEVETAIAALATVEDLTQSLKDELAAGTVKTNEETLSAGIAALTTGVAGVRDLIAEKVKFFEAEHAAADELNKQVDDLEVLQQSLDTTWAVYDDIDNDKDAAALNAAYQAIREAIATERGDIATDLTNGNVQANADAHETAIGDINDAIKALQDNVREYEQFYADEHALAADYDKQVADLEVLQQSLDTTWAVYDDIDNDKDAAALNAAYQAIREAIATERGAIADDLEAGHVQANADAHETAIGDINDAIKALQDNVREYEQFYADEHALADKYNDELNNLETLRDALGTVWDAYETLEDCDKTLAALHNDWQAITEDIAAERTALADDLEAGHVQANATDHETALSDIADAIKTLQDKVRDIEEFKATNDKNYASLVEATKDLLASLEDVKYVSDDVYELLPATEAAADLDQESIEAAREAAETLATDELTALETALAEGKLYTEEEVADQQAKIDEVADALAALKEQVKAAEDFHRANAEANDKLEEKVQALVTIINTAKANSVCDLCNDEDTADLEAELDAVYEILGNVAESFAVGHLAMPTAADSYAKYMQDLTGVEADVQATLDEIAEHKIRQINDQNAYNVLQKALVDVDLALANIELEEGWENFKIRGAHLDPTMCVGVESNPDVKYLNELTDAVTDLKQLIEAQHAHAGVEDAALLGDKVGLGHVCEENKIEDLKLMKGLIADVQKTIEAIRANEAAHQTIQDRFAELFADAKDAYEFWNKYYSHATLITHEGDIANWIQEWNGELENGYALAELENLLHNSYVHGNAAYKWTVDAQGKELNELAVNTFTEYDEELANDRNEFAHTEALNHYAKVREVVDTYYNNTISDYTYDGLDDPFVKDILDSWREEVEGEYGLYASLNTFKADIEAAYEEGVMEDAINIDEHNTALGIHQQLDGVLGVLSQIEEEYADLFEDAHHLTNGKTIYSDQEYFTLGFFKKANEGLGEQGQEMFKTVTVLDKSLIYIDDESDKYKYADVMVLTHGDKSNELSFNNIQTSELERTTLKAGEATVHFAPGSISVVADVYGNEWVTKHPVSIDGVEVAAPEEEVVDAPVMTSSNKLIVRLDAPIDLTYTINSLVARTDNGTEFSYADRELNYAKHQIEFTLPEGTTSVELPEGFFTFRTGENSIARSAAMTVTVGNITSIDTLIAMGEKAEIFDLQGRRVKAESLISGSTYVVNGEKVMVK